MDLKGLFENSEVVTNRGESGNKSIKAKGKMAIPGYAIVTLYENACPLPGTNPSRKFLGIVHFDDRIYIIGEGYSSNFCVNMLHLLCGKLMTAEEASDISNMSGGQSYVDFNCSGWRVL